MTGEQKEQGWHGGHSSASYAHVPDTNELFLSQTSWSGGNVCSRHPSGSLPHLAALRQLPGACVWWPPPDCGHPGGASLCHGGERGPGNRHMRPQHCALQASVQSFRQVHTETQAASTGLYLCMNTCIPHKHTVCNGSKDCGVRPVNSADGSKISPFFSKSVNLTVKDHSHL